MNHNHQSELLGQGSYFIKGMMILKHLIFIISIFYFIILILNDFTLLTFLMIIVAFLNLIYNTLGLLYSMHPTLENLHKLKKQTKIIGIIHIFSLIIPFLAFKHLYEVKQDQQNPNYIQDQNSHKKNQVQQNEEIIQGMVFTVLKLLSYAFICILDYGNYVIANFWIYIALQKNANQHPPPHIDGDQTNLLNVSVPLGPGKCFLILCSAISGIFGSFIMILYVLFSVFDINSVIYLPLAGYYFYHYGIGLSIASSPTLSKLHKFKKSSKILVCARIIAFFIGIGIKYVTSQSQVQSLQQQEISVFTILMGILIYGLIFMILNAPDYINYMIASFWIYIILQHNANQHPPPHMFDYEKQFDIIRNKSISDSNANNNNQIMNNQQNRDYIELANENA